MGRVWTEEEKRLASIAYADRAAAKKSANAKGRIRINAGDKRDILSLGEAPPGYVRRVVNDTPGRIKGLQARGYELVEQEIQTGTPHVDGNQAYAGVTSREVGKGMTAYVMQQRDKFYQEDKADKQRLIDESEQSMVRDNKPHETTDGSYGKIKIG